MGADFLREIQVHHDMNLELELLTKKFYMLIYSCLLVKQKLSWLKMWNEYDVLKISQAQVFKLIIRQMVTQGNLLASCILFMDDHFFFIFSQGCSPSYFALVLVT
jgi:hypothetical protein